MLEIKKDGRKVTITYSNNKDTGHICLSAHEFEQECASCPDLVKEEVAKKLLGELASRTGSSMVIA